jgi:DNA-binding GntR family transcriptional regulator
MIYQSCTNHFLTLMLNNISDLINLCRPFSVERSPITHFTWGHLAIIDAVLSGDRPKAREETRAHITTSKDSLLEFLKNHRAEISREYHYGE